MTSHSVALSMPAATLVLLALALSATSVFADGEAGVVVVWGDGTSSSVCVAFEGDSISGDALLAGAGLGTNELSGLVCSINDVGCTHSGTFNSCLCQCQTGSRDCSYWSFFTRDYGAPWRYSATGFRSVSSSNGDLQSWQWLPASSAAPPQPPSAIFEDVCGHAPLFATQPPPVSTVPPTSTPLSTATGAPPMPVASVTHSAVPSVPSMTLTAQPGDTSVTAATPMPPSTGEPDSDDATGAWIRFGAVAAVLLLAMGAVLVVRARRGK